jgi:hypothetical protein
VIYWACGALVVALLMFAPILGYLSSPLAPFWLKGNNAIPPPVIVEPMAGPPDPRELDDLPRAGHVTDVQRYQLARMAGFNSTDAITMTAISIAEDGSGDPAALSALNKNGTRDLGLWQINTIWWVQFGGASALVDPWRNAQAAYYIKGRQGYCAWSTYLASCGPGHSGSFAAFMARAEAAARAEQATPA